MRRDRVFSVCCCPVFVLIPRLLLCLSRRQLICFFAICVVHNLLHSSRFDCVAVGGITSALKEKRLQSLARKWNKKKSERRKRKKERKKKEDMRTHRALVTTD